MSDFVVRIELHRENDYEPLHAAMAARGLSRLIRGGDGVTYKLPTGVYYVEKSKANGETVHATAKAAAHAVGHYNAAILVVDSKECRWTGLDPATPLELKKGA